jgi:dTDP-4-amino-4,6-dideoxygalactose transaminase
LYHHFKQHDIHPRRYFYPLIPEFEMYRHLASANIAKLPIAKQVSERVLCLPIYPDMPREVQQKIVSLILALAQGTKA